MKHNLQRASLLDEFQTYLQVIERSINTNKSYVIAVRKYSEWFSSRYAHEPKQLFQENISEYKEYLKRLDTNPSTFNARMAGLRAWNDFLIANGVQQEIVVSRTDYRKVQKQYASPAIHTIDEMNQFIQTVLEQGSKRDYALVNFLAYTGLRVSESLNQKIVDMHFGSREMVVKDGKGDKMRTVYLMDRVIRIVRGYLNNERQHYRFAAESPYVFLSNRNEQLSRITFYKALDKYSKIAGIEPHITPHDFRHFFCTYFLENGFDVHEVAAMAGHSNIHTTLLYTNPSRKRILEKMNAME